LIHPFPADELLPYVQGAKKVVVVENNATGQLANILKMNIASHDKIQSVLKYDGNPFLPQEVYAKSKEMFVLNGNV
jgi:2-oxoglutarate ferredoxin oxidoreductase subunit alpha